MPCCHHHRRHFNHRCHLHHCHHHRNRSQHPASSSAAFISSQLNCPQILCTNEPAAAKVQCAEKHRQAVKSTFMSSILMEFSNA